VKHGQINAYGGEITMSKITNKKTKAVMVCIDSSKLQTMTAFNQKLLRGVQGGGFLEKSPPGRRRQKKEDQ
jgi:hypothetical protein